MKQGGWRGRHRTGTERRAGRVRGVPWRSMIAGTVVLGSFVWVVPGASAGETARQGLPGYGYELVSPPSTAGQDPDPTVIGNSGEDVLFRSSGGFADVGNLLPVGHTYRAKRTPSGWVTESLGLPPASEFPGGVFGGVALLDSQPGWWQADRPRLLANAETPYVAGGPDNGPRNLVGTKGGEWSQVSLAMDVTADNGSLGTLATAEDLSAVLESRKNRLPLTDGTVDTRGTDKQSLVVSRRRPDGTLERRQIARQGGVSMFATTPVCEIQLGSTGNGVKRGAVDRDGLKRVIWTTQGTGCTTGVRQRVYVTEPFSSSPDAFDISASKCTVSCGTAQPVRFAGASVDTERIFMTTTQKLLDVDSNTLTDIYEYDFRRLAPDRLRLVTGDATPANVLGVVTVSDSGSHMYFVARGALSDAVTGDTAPVAGAPNLYVRISPSSGGPAATRFLATLDEADALGLWGGAARQAVATPDGRYLVVTSRAALTDDKQPGDTLPDVYRIDSSTGRIERAWVSDPAHNGALRSEGSDGPTNAFAHRSTANFEWNQQSMSVATDGSAFIFTSKEPLVAGDDNANSDVFVWTASDGAVSMISDGHDPQGITTSNVRMTPDGNSFVFKTRSQLVPQHTATSLGMYAYRRGGGFPLPEGPPTPCAGDACQGPLVGTPGFGESGSGVFVGGGNETPMPPIKPTVRIAGGGSARGTTVRLRVRASAAGQIRIAGSGVRTVTRSVTRAGTYTVRVRLSAKGTKNLKHKGRLKVSARVRLSDKTGQSASTRASLTFTTKKRSHRPKTKPKSQASARLAVGSGR